MKPAHAVAELRDGDDTKRLGTAFAISRTLALTAFHCVRGRDRVLLRFIDQTIPAIVVHDRKGQDEQNDLALLELDSRLDPELPYLVLSADAVGDVRVIAIGFPYAVAAPRLTVGGSIRNPHAEHPVRRHATNPDRYIQWLCEEAMTSLQLRGLSGAPLIIDPSGSPRAVGVVIYNEPDAEGAAKGAAVWAASANTVAVLWPDRTDALLRRRTRQIVVGRQDSEPPPPQPVELEAGQLASSELLSKVYAPLSVRWKDNESLVVATRGGDIISRRINDGGEVIPKSGAYACYLAVGPDNQVAAVRYQKLQVLNFTSGHERLVPIDSADGGRCVEWRSDGEALAVGGTNVLRVFDASLELIATKQLGGQYGVRSLIFKGESLWIGLGNGELRRAEPPYREWESVYRRPSSAIIALQVGEDGVIAMLWQDGLIELWADGVLRHSLRTPGNDSWTAAGPLLALGPRNTPIVWCSGVDRSLYAARPSGETVWRTRFPVDVTCLDLSPDGTLLAIGLHERTREDASVILVRTDTLEHLMTGQAPEPAPSRQDHLLGASWAPLISHVKADQAGAADLDEITVHVPLLEQELDNYQRRIEESDAEPGILEQVSNYLRRVRSRAATLSDDTAWLATKMIPALYSGRQIATALDRFVSFRVADLLGELHINGYPMAYSLEEFVSFVLGTSRDDLVYLGFDAYSGGGNSAMVPVDMLLDLLSPARVDAIVPDAQNSTPFDIVAAALAIGDFDYLFSDQSQRRLWCEVVLPQAAARYQRERVIVSPMDVQRVGFA
jgi:hypothetical protein